MTDWFIAVTVAKSVTMSPVLLKLLKRKGTRAVERLMEVILIITPIQMLFNGVQSYLLLLP